MRTRLAAMVLAFEAITCGLAIPVASMVAESGGAAKALTLLAVIAILTAAVLKRPGGFVVAWIVQCGMLATAIAVPAFAFIAVPFVALWWYCLRIGSRIDREREELHPPEAPPRADVP